MDQVDAAYPKKVALGKRGPYHSYKSPRLLIGHHTSQQTAVSQHSTQHMTSKPKIPLIGQKMFRKTLGKPTTDSLLYYANIKKANRSKK